MFLHAFTSYCSKELNKGQMVTLSNQEVGKRSKLIEQNIGMRLLWRQVPNFTQGSLLEVCFENLQLHSKI